MNPNTQPLQFRHGAPDTPSGEERSIPLRLLEPEILELSAENPDGLVIIDQQGLAERLSVIQDLLLHGETPRSSFSATRRLFLPTEHIGRQRLLEELSNNGARFFANTVSAFRRLELSREGSSCLVEANEGMIHALSSGRINVSDGMTLLIRTCRQARLVIDAQLASPAAPLPIVVSLTHEHIESKQRPGAEGCSAQTLPRRGLSEPEMECMLGYCQPLSRDSGLVLTGLHLNLDAVPEHDLQQAALFALKVWKRLPSPWGIATAPQLLLESKQDPASLKGLLQPFLRGTAAASDSLRLLWTGHLLDGAVYEVMSSSAPIPSEIVRSAWNPSCTQGAVEYLLDLSGELQLVRRSFDPLFSLSYEP